MLFKKLKKPDPEAEQKLLDEIEAYGGLEKNDVLAMILSALLMIMPIVGILLLILCFFAFLFFSQLHRRKKEACMSALQTGSAG